MACAESDSPHCSGLSDFRKDALATALHVYYLQRKYPYVGVCPCHVRDCSPIINNEKINPLDVHEKELCQVLCAYRIFLPFVGDHGFFKRTASISGMAS